MRLITGSWNWSSTEMNNCRVKDLALSRVWWLGQSAALDVGHDAECSDATEGIHSTSFLCSSVCSTQQRRSIRLGAWCVKSREGSGLAHSTPDRCFTVEEAILRRSDRLSVQQRAVGRPTGAVLRELVGWVVARRLGFFARQDVNRWMSTHVFRGPCLDQFPPGSYRHKISSISLSRNGSQKTQTIGSKS